MIWFVEGNPIECNDLDDHGAVKIIIDRNERYEL